MKPVYISDAVLDVVVAHAHLSTKDPSQLFQVSLLEKWIKSPRPTKPPEHSVKQKTISSDKVV